MDKADEAQKVEKVWEADGERLCEYGTANRAA